jgi:N-acetylneuraminic acid mutarotase
VYVTDVDPMNGRTSRKAWIAVAAVIVVVAAAVVVDRMTGDDAVVATPPSGASSPTPNAGAIPTGWTKLSLPPQVRTGSAVVWTGSQLLDWGGCDPAINDRCEAVADGYAFDPASRTWSDLPPAPVAGSGAHAIWTGSEALFIGFDSESKKLHSEAFDPATRTWRKLATAPIGPRYSPVLVWTGSKLVVWGGSERDQPGIESTGAMFDPATNTWELMADAPHGLNLASGVWTGDRVLVFGSLVNGRNHADTTTSVGETYDPATDHWHEIARSNLSPQATSAVWTGGRLVAWDYNDRWQTYDPNDDRWSATGRMPMQPSECYPDSALVGASVFGFFCGQAALYDAATNAWSKVRGGMLAETIYSKAYKSDIKLWRFADMAAGGDVLYFEAEGISLTKNGEACYGCSGSPHSFWAYRPA